MKLILSLLIAISFALTAIPSQQARAYDDPPNSIGFINQSVVGASLVSTKWMSARSKRGMLIVQNLSPTAQVTVKFGSASTSNEGISLGASTIFQGPYQDSVYIKSNVPTGTSPVLLMEGIL